MATCDTDVLALEKIMEKGKSVIGRHFIIEQDMVQNPEIALKVSFDIMQNICADILDIFGYGC